MALTSPDSLRTKGALAVFHEAVGKAPEIWRNHCQVTQSTTNAETYAMLGFAPQPRQFLNGRQFQNMVDMDFTLTNNEYELSMIINRKHWEDDQTGLIRQRFAELGEVWGSFRDNLFAQLLAAGSDSGNTSFDGTTFFHTDHVLGTTGQTNDNDLTTDITAPTQATVVEFKAALVLAYTAAWNFSDDTGAPFNGQGSMVDFRLIVSPQQAPAAFEMLDAVNRPGTSGGDTPAWTGTVISGIDILPWIIVGTDDDEVYWTINGSTRRGFIYQERTPLEVIVLDGANDVAENNGVKVLSRQRFVMAYGDHRRAILHTFT